MIRGEMNFQQRRKYMLGRWPIIFSISVQNCSIPENKREKLHCKKEKRNKKFKQMLRDISVELIYHVGHIVPLDRISTFSFAVVVENQLLRYMNALTDLHLFFCFFDSGMPHRTCRKHTQAMNLSFRKGNDLFNFFCFTFNRTRKIFASVVKRVIL